MHSVLSAIGGALPGLTLARSVVWYLPVHRSAAIGSRSLSLYNSGLTAATLPSSLSALTALQYVFVVITVVVMTDITFTSSRTCGPARSHGRVLDLRTNTLSGTIPDVLTTLTSLSALYMCCNSFFGSIPSTISALTRLTYLDFVTLM